MSCQNNQLNQKTTPDICSKHQSKTSFFSERMNEHASQMRSRLGDCGRLFRGSGNSLPVTNLKPSKRACGRASMRVDESAQVAVILFFFLAITFIAFYWMVMGPVMDTLTTTHNNLSAQGMPLTQDRQDSLIFLQGTFGSIPIIAFILTIIVAIIGGLASKYSVI
jgi:hypothetical protein